MLKFLSKSSRPIEFDRLPVFNPSELQVNGKIYQTHRALDSLAKKIVGSRLIVADGKKRDVYDLEGIFSKKNIAVKDPKLLLIDEIPYLTFNTGTEKNKNSIYLCAIGDDDFDVKEIEILGRRKTEKNILFFKPNSDLRAIYEPFDDEEKVVIISKDKYSFSVEDTVKEVHLSLAHRIIRRLFKIEHSFGSQICKHGDSNFVTVNYKIYIFGKRVYLVKIFEIVSVGGRLFWKPKSGLLCHSLRSLFGSSYKFNPNLIGCTYSSGLSVGDHVFEIFYGVNDRSGHCAKVNKK